VGSPKLR